MTVSGSPSEPGVLARDRLMILAAALLFSTGGAAIKACTLNAWQVASFRSGVAFLALALMLPSARRGFNLRTLAVGAAYATTMILFVLANKLTTAANTIFLQSTAPLYILLLGPWLLGEHIRRRDLIFTAAMAGGMSLLLLGQPPAAVTAPEPLRGNLVALASGVAWALTILGLRWLGRDGSGDAESSVAAVVTGNVLALLFALPLALPVAASRPADWLTIAFLGVFQIALAYVFLTRGVRRVGALEASLLLLVEPVLNPVWAWLAHGEAPGPWALAGGAVILGATTLKTWLER